MSRGKVNYDAKIIIRISKEEKDLISEYCKANQKSLSELTREYYKTLTNELDRNDTIGQLYGE